MSTLSDAQMLDAFKAKYGSMENAARTKYLPIPSSRYSSRFRLLIFNPKVSVSRPKNRSSMNTPLVTEFRFYEDRGISGGAKLTKRPGLLSLIEDLQPGMAIVISNTD